MKPKTRKNLQFIISGLLIILIIPLFFIVGESITRVYYFILGLALVIILPKESKFIAIFPLLIGSGIPILSDINDYLSPKPDVVVYVNRNYIINQSELDSNLNVNGFFLSTDGNQQIVILKQDFLTPSNNKFSPIIKFNPKNSLNSYLYIITIKNEGNISAKQIKLYGQIDEQFKIEESDPLVQIGGTTESKSPFGGSFYFEIPELAPGKDVQITLSSERLGELEITTCDINGHKCDYGLSDYKAIMFDHYPYCCFILGDRSISVPDKRDGSLSLWGYNYEANEWKNVEDSGVSCKKAY